MKAWAGFMAWFFLAVAAAAEPAAPVSQPSARPAASAAKFPTGPGALAGLWKMRGYIGSAGRTARARIAHDINDKLPPLLPWAHDLLEKRVNDADQGDELFANSMALCLPQGVPYLLFGAVEGPVQIYEEQNQVTVITEEGAEIWDIYLDQQHPPRDDIEPTYHGDSVAHWQGDTLVVDTVGLNDKTTLDQVGMPHSEAMHVTTRIQRTGADTLEFLVTVDDPKTFSAPWTRRVIYTKAAAGERRREYVCDNNRNQSDAQGHQSFQVR